MEIFSPIHRLSFQSHDHVWIKRDDMIDPYISGNKWRKLKYLLEDAVSKGKTHLVTFGGAYSNHLVATAAAAARNKFTSTAFVRGEAVNNEMLLLCKLFGMNLIFTNRDDYKNKRSLFEAKFGNENDVYFIDEGGASEEAVKGCSAIIADLPQTFRHVFCAAGTGTTAAGLLRTINRQRLNTQLHVVAALKGGSFLNTTIQKYEADLSRLTLHNDYHFGGYAKTTPELLSFTKSFITATGVLIDPVYTAKMFFAINDLITKGSINKNDSILAIHTGGLLGILGMKEKLY